MKMKINTVFPLTAVLFFFAVTAVQAIPTVSIELMDSDIIVGESFDAQIWVDGDNLGEELLAFGFDVSMDTGLFFSYDSYTIESGFDDDSWGANNVAGSSFPGISDNNVLLATLSFTASAVGNDSMSVSGPFDGMFSGLYYDFSGFSLESRLNITVNDGSGTDPIPEPATMLLFGTGLAGLIGNRWRKKKK